MTANTGISKSTGTWWRTRLWSLPHPLPEGYAAAEHICFYPAKVEIVVDGARIVD